MPLETASYLNQLNTANPAPTDLLAQGDDHIRLIKAVLKATFPNITGPVTLTQAELNALASLNATPFGIITAWYGASTAVPSGWAICNGQTVAKSDGSGNITVPDLRDRVILGTGTLQPTVQGTHGAANQSATTAASGAHSHSTTAGGGGQTHTGVSVGGTSLTLSQIPSHTHGLKVYDRADTDALGSGGAGDNTVSTGSAYTAGYVESVGSGAAHTHPMSWPTTPDGTHTHTTDSAAAHTHGVTVAVYQPAMSLHYIMKV